MTRLPEAAPVESSPRWEPAPEKLRLERRQVDVWRVRGPLPARRQEELIRLLSAEERERAARLRVERARETFVAARGLLRVALSRYLTCDPRDLLFGCGPNGKPELAGPHGNSGIQFNVSHTARLALVAVARERPVGIDVERVRRNIEHVQLARRFFARSEVERLRQLTRPEERLRGFFRCWTRKEAYLKLKGEGLSLGLARFEVTLLPDEPPRLLRTAIEGDRAADFCLTDIDAQAGHVASLIVPGPEPELRLWELRAMA